MTRKQKHLLTRILVAAVLFLAGSLLHLPVYVEMGVFLVCYAVVGWDIVWKAITNILHIVHLFCQPDSRPRRFTNLQTWKAGS